MRLLRKRSMLLGGLRLALGRPGALVWTYMANLGVALLFSLRLHAQLASLLDHSLAAERINSAFDFGTVGAAMMRLGHQAPSAGATPYSGVPVYFLIYFLLVPGALLCYRMQTRARLSLLLTGGICFFWRFVRITLLTVLVSAIVLGPLFALQGAWARHVTEHVVGVSAVYHELVGWAVVLLVASVLRLYFDLVEVYTVQLDDRYRANGKPDRRVRKTLIPAAKTMWRNLPRAFGSFILLGILGLLAIFWTVRIAVDMLAQPRVWPAFLVVQAGMFVSLLTRFWQRGAETILVDDNPLPISVALNDGAGIQPSCSAIFMPVIRPVVVEPAPVVVVERAMPIDAMPDPEPAAPSLEQADPGVFRGTEQRDEEDELGRIQE